MTQQEQALIEAAKIGNLVEVQRLVNLGIKSFLCALREALTNKHLDVVKYLLDQESDCNLYKLDTIVQTSRNGHLEVVKYLIEQGADIHAYDDYAFRLASLYGHLEIVKYLVEKGADIHSYDDYAIRYACRNGHLEVVEYLKSIGCGRVNYPQKPEGFQFRNNEECPIIQVILTDEMEKNRM